MKQQTTKKRAHTTFQRKDLLKMCLQLRHGFKQRGIPQKASPKAEWKKAGGDPLKILCDIHYNINTIEWRIRSGELTISACLLGIAAGILASEDFRVEQQ